MKTNDADCSSSATSSCFLIIEGRDDLSSRFSNRVTCLLGGGYVVRIPETYRDSDNVEVRCIKSGEFASCTVGAKLAVVDNELSPVTIEALDLNTDNNLNQLSDEQSLNNRAAVVATVIAHNASDKTIDIFVV